MSTLTGTQIANTYKQLLQVGTGNVGLTSSLQTVQDGDAANSPLQLSNSAVNINGTFQLSGVTLTASASTLNAVADLTGATGIVAVSAGNVYGRTLTAGTGITIGNGSGTEGNPTIALSTTGITVSFAGIKATSATFAETVSAAFFVGDGSGLTNVPSAEGGTMKFITAGTGINFTVNGVTSTTIPVSGTVNINTNQSFGIVSATNIDADELLVAGVSVATVTEVAAVSATLATSIGNSNTNIAAVSVLTSVNAAAITSVSNFAVALSATMATSIGNSNTNIAAVSVLTSVNLAAITSVSNFAVALSATMATSIGNSNTNITTNINAITSINAIIGDGTGFATDAELAAVSATMATSIGTANTRITSVSNYAVALSATLATSIGTANTRITSVSDFAVALSATLATSIGTANTRITSVSDFAVALSATMATSIGTANTRITSVSDFAVALSATMATSIATRLPLAGGTITGIVSGTDFYVSAVAIGVDTLLGKQLHIGTAAVADIVSLTDGATIAVDFNTGQNFAVQLGGNRTLGNPTNCVPGQTGSAFIIQDGTGGRTLSYGSNWEFAGGTAPTLSTAAAAVDRLDYIVYTSTGVHSIATLDVK
jgi:hypothetical protein